MFLCPAVRLSPRLASAIALRRDVRHRPDDEDNPRAEAYHKYCHEGYDYTPFQDVYNTKPLGQLTTFMILTEYSSNLSSRS